MAVSGNLIALLVVAVGVLTQARLYEDVGQGKYKGVNVSNEMIGEMIVSSIDIMMAFFCALPSVPYVRCEFVSFHSGVREWLATLLLLSE